MSEFKGTPGPWAWDEPANWHGVAARVYHEADGKYEPVAQVQISGWPRRVGLANARLIAASPDLLAEHADAIGYLEEMANSEAHDGRERYAAQIRDAVARMKATQAKATGT